MTITKADLIDQVHATSPRMTKIQAREAVEAILLIIKSRLENGDDVLLSGFGKFNVKAKSARKGRNPQTGESVMLEARKVVTFKPSGLLRKKVNSK
jgi:integration host factor subunit alpha